MSAHEMKAWTKKEAGDFFAAGYRTPEEIAAMCSNRVGVGNPNMIRRLIQEGNLADDARIEKRIAGGRGHFTMFLPVELQITVLEILAERPKFRSFKEKFNGVIESHLRPKLKPPPET